MHVNSFTLVMFSRDVLKMGICLMEDVSRIRFPVGHMHCERDGTAHVLMLPTGQGVLSVLFPGQTFAAGQGPHSPLTFPKSNDQPGMHRHSSKEEDPLAEMLP
jgi:hypothetical protein